MSAGFPQHFVAKGPLILPGMSAREIDFSTDPTTCQRSCRMSAPKKNRKPSYYTNEFKRLVLHRLLCSDGQSVRSLAQEIGIAKSTLWDWQREVGRALDMTDSKPPSRDT